MKYFPHGSIIPLIHMVIVSPLLLYSGMCLRGNKNCIYGFSELLMALGIAVFLYHLYKLLIAFKVIENFARPGGYLGRPAEPFVPFSFPYHNETDRHYSFHDDEHTRNCNCKHNDGHSGCKEGFDTISPAQNSIVGSGF